MLENILNVALILTSGQSVQRPPCPDTKLQPTLAERKKRENQRHHQTYWLRERRDEGNRGEGKKNKVKEN
jgi:hypothetical protein